MKDGTEKKGLVVEQHEDRVLLNTEQGEVPVMRDKIENIVFDDPEQTFLQLGESNEKVQRWGEALAYYEKALQVNPNFEEAKQAAVRVRNQFWSKAAAGPNSEIEKRQSLYDSWGMGKPAKKKNDDFKSEAKAAAFSLRSGLGLVLAQKGDWVVVQEITAKKDAATAGLRKNDRLAAIDGRSLRYLSVDVVREKFLSPRYSNFTLEYERDVALQRTGLEKDLAEFGLQVKLEEYQGLVVERIQPGSRASVADIRPGDLLVAVDGAPLRYLPLKKLFNAVMTGSGDHATLSLRRSTLLSRK